MRQDPWVSRPDAIEALSRSRFDLLVVGGGIIFSAVAAHAARFGLRFALPDDLQNINALKNVLAGVVNGVAALVFIAVAHVAWAPAALIAGGAVVGAHLAARYGRRLPSSMLRAVVIVVGLAAIVQLVR